MSIVYISIEIIGIGAILTLINKNILIE